MSRPLLPPSPRIQRTLGTALAVALGAALVGLAWIDVLPGGWTLRGLVEDHAVRRGREQAERSAERLATFADENATAPAGSVVFLGSSTIERFPLRTAFPRAACLDRGIGNESAIECLRRLDASLPSATPAGFVVYLASLDFRRDGAGPTEVVRRAGRILDFLGVRYPDAPIVAIGLLSERHADLAFVGRWRATNRALRKAAQARGIDWISVDRPPITSPEGRLAEDMSADRLHLNDAGYEQLRAWILESGTTVADTLQP